MLWKEFLTRHGAELYLAACKEYTTEKYVGMALFSEEGEIGSPVDFIEEMFLRTIRRYETVLVSSDGDLQNLDSRDAFGAGDIFARYSVLATTETIEQGADRKTLKEMTSPQFVAWPHKLLFHRWKQAYPTPETVAAAHALIPDTPFQRLPMFYQRHRFLLPSKELPWWDDLVDTAFVRDVVRPFLGRAIAVSKQEASKWRRTTLNAPVKDLFDGGQRVGGKRGRPRKIDAALKKVDQLYPDGSYPSMRVLSEELCPSSEFLEPIAA